MNTWEDLQRVRGKIFALTSNRREINSLQWRDLALIDFIETPL